MSEPTYGDLAAHVRNEQFAALISLMIGLAAEQNPDVLRDALAGVFDLAFYEDQARRVMLVACDAQSQAAQIRELLAVLDDKLNKQEHWIDQLHARLDAAARKTRQLKRRSQ